MAGPDEGRTDTRQLPPAVRILVVDDDPAARAAVRGVLAVNLPTTQVEEIVDHVGFFRALQGRAFDAVITEHTLHWSTGAEVLAAVKAVHPMIPVVMVAGSDDREAMAGAQRAGLDAWVAKGPGFEDRLRSALRTALQLVEFTERVSGLEARQQALLDRIGVGVFRARLDGRMLEANPAFLDLVGVESQDAIRDRSLDELLGREGLRLELLELIGVDGMVRDLELAVAETEQWVELTVTCESVGDGELVLEGLVEDVTEARRTRLARRLANEQYRTVFETTSAATVIVDEDGTIALVNAAFAELTGHLRSQLEGERAWGEFIAGPDRDRVVELEPPDDAPHTVEFRLLDQEGRPLDMRATVARLPGTSRTVWSLIDLTRRLQAEAQVLHGAFHDALTGLPNRHALLDRLDELYAGGGVEKAVLLLLDLDRFGVVNDGLGHRVGDRLLKAVARRLQRTISAELIACLGGNTFGFLLEAVADPRRAIRVAAEIQLELGRPFSVAGRQVFTSASFGIAHAAEAEAAEELLRNAEAAMNQAKATGRNRWVVFEPAMVETAARAFEVENDLRRAFSADELRVLYQPVVRLVDREVSAFEALVRWQHPNEGLVGPARFLAVADDAGLTVPLGRWVLSEACRSLRGWLSAASGLTIGVNLTLRQLLHPDLPDDISRMLEQLVLPAERLELELGEGLVAADTEAVAATLARLSDLGVRLCLDDFGSGWASLGMLHRVPFARVKLDRSLLVGIGDDPLRWRVLERVHEVARSLDLEVVVQGVEDEPQLERLLAIGCEVGQGHLLGAPMEPAAAARLLAD